ncbi:Uncharacterized protein dnm_075940 [Desulfonema magnum]|uniref:Uncharacterized protein n=1 Tax=Desulfonema magnum TaxID=45655 RepID=A0A975BUS0_9BACT|nr:Uncharacterized protein dnm_075940 [Desulfonema magnum]
MTRKNDDKGLFSSEINDLTKTFRYFYPEYENNFSDYNGFWGGPGNTAEHTEKRRMFRILGR